MVKKIANKQIATVFIGRKPMKEYLIECLTLLGSGNNSLVLKARGQAITTCVDTVEVLKRQNPNIKVDSIILGTEEIQDQRTQRPRNVSTMEITVSI
jgi:DNA-binding protein Alba